jgi:hypothetical protein
MTAVTDEMVEAGLAAMNRQTLDSRLPWSGDDKFLMRAALTAALAQAEPALPPLRPSMPAHAVWCQPGDMQAERHWLLRHDDRDCPDLVFTDETEARTVWTRRTLSFNCWLFQAAAIDAETTADQLRAAGWSVAVHNDYRLHGEPHTFWLWTHPDGRWIKGEGRTDAAALEQCAIAIAAPSPPIAAETERCAGIADTYAAGMAKTRSEREAAGKPFSVAECKEDAGRSIASLIRGGKA